MFRLMMPHFRYTLAINAAARGVLVNAGGESLVCHCSVFHQATWVAHSHRPLTLVALVGCLSMAQSILADLQGVSY